MNSSEPETVEQSIPWRLESADGRDLRINYVTMHGGAQVTTELARVEVDESPERVVVSVVERLSNAADGRVGVYFDVRETTISLKRPIGDRRLEHGPVADGTESYAEILAEQR